jgi:hypothetical protein
MVTRADSDPRRPWRGRDAGVGRPARPTGGPRARWAVAVTGRGWSRQVGASSPPARPPCVSAVKARRVRVSIGILPPPRPRGHTIRDPVSGRWRGAVDPRPRPGRARGAASDGTASGGRARRGGRQPGKRERERGTRSFVHHPSEAVILGCHPEFFPKGVRAPLFSLSGARSCSWVT